MSRPSLLQRLVLAAFPARYRARYGAELAALVPRCTGGWRVTADLARAALLAWVRPSFTGPPAERRRRRLQATTATVFALWSVSTVAAAAFAWAVDDEPGPGLRSWGSVAFQVGSGVFQAATGVVLLVGFCYWLRVVVPGWRSRDRGTLFAACLPVVVVLLWLGGTGLLAVATHRLTPAQMRHVSAQGPTTAAGWLLLAGYLVFTTVCVLACVASTLRALDRSRLPERLLGWATLVAAAVTTALAVVTVAAAVCLSRVLLVGGAGGRNAVLAVLAVAVLLTATVAAATSTGRGLRTTTG